MGLDWDYNRAGTEQVAAAGDGYRIRALYDQDAESTRTAWDNVATMVCSHRRYNLGDYENGESVAREAVRNSRDYRPTWEETESGQFRFKGETRDCLDLSDARDLWQAIALCSDIESMPLYLYDHSGLSISTGKFSCPWDSGQVGFAFITRDRFLKDWGTFKRWNQAARQQAREVIESEVQTYDTYLRGNVYGYIAERLEPGSDPEDSDSWEQIDSCWGYYGSDHEESGLEESALAAIAYDRRQRKAARETQLKTLIKAGAPLWKRQQLLSAAP